MSFSVVISLSFAFSSLVSGLSFPNRTVSHNGLLFVPSSSLPSTPLSSSSSSLGTSLLDAPDCTHVCNPTPSAFDSASVVFSCTPDVAYGTSTQSLGVFAFVETLMTRYWPNVEYASCTEVYTLGGMTSTVPFGFTFAHTTFLPIAIAGPTGSTSPIDSPNNSQTSPRNTNAKSTILSGLITQGATAMVPASEVFDIPTNDVHPLNAENTSPNGPSACKTQPRETSVETSPGRSPRLTLQQTQPRDGSVATTTTRRASLVRTQGPRLDTLKPQTETTSETHLKLEPTRIAGAIASIYDTDGAADTSTRRPSPPLVDHGPVITVGSATYGSNVKTEYVISDQTLQAGAAITIGSGVDATTVSLQTDAQVTNLSVNGKTTSLDRNRPGSNDVTSHVDLDSIVATQDADRTRTAKPKPPARTDLGFVIGSQKLLPGSTAIVSGHTYSLGTGGSIVYYDGVSQKLPVGGATPVVTLSNGVVITGTMVTPAMTGPVGQITNAKPSPASPITRFPEYLIGTNTLSPGVTAVVSGHTYSLANIGSVIYVDGHPQIISAHGVTPVATLSNGVVITKATGVPSFPANDGSSNNGVVPTSTHEVLVNGEILLPGSTVVVSGTTYSLPASGPTIYVNGRPQTLPPHGAQPLATLSNGDVITEVGINTLRSSQIGETGASSSMTVIMAGSSGLVQASMFGIAVAAVSLGLMFM